MSTKDELLLLKDDRRSFLDVNSHSENRKYFNLNLNQTTKISNNSFIQVYSKSSNDKQLVSHNYETNLQSLNKTSLNDLYSNSVITNYNVVDEKEETKKRWKTSLNNNSSSNNSTLSLHISAYENNLTENITSDSSGDGKKSLKKKKEEKSNKKWKNEKQVFTSFIQSPFEFPRQQEEDKIIIPEVMQFKASQHLFDPHQSASSVSSQSVHQRPPQPFDTDTMDDRREHGYDIAMGTQSISLVFLEALRFQKRYFVSAFSSQTILDVKNMLKDIMDPNGSMELHAFHPSTNFTLLKDESTLSECGFRAGFSSFSQPGTVYLTFGQENPEYVADSRNKPVPQSTS